MEEKVEKEKVEKQEKVEKRSYQALPSLSERASFDSGIVTTATPNPR